jgi:hypothetical protein
VQLLRLATVRLAGPPPLAVDRVPYVASNGVEVRPDSVDGIPAGSPASEEAPPAGALTFYWPREDQRVRVGVFATVDAGTPSIRNGRLDVPEEPRQRAEAAIGEFADLLAVIHQCRRSIRSPQPSVGLAPSSDEDSSKIGEVRGLNQRSTGRGAARVMPPTTPTEGSLALSDRFDGLALLADALSEDTAVARAREFFRFFELAFRQAASQCAPPLAAFLKSNPRHADLVFTTKEVSHWFDPLRAEATHADRRPSFLRSPDLEPYLGRLEIAAYDVLFNKTIWHHPSVARRTRQDFMSGISPDRNSVVVFQPNATLIANWIDPYNVYPVDHETTVTLQPPWIWRLPGQDDDGSQADPALVS